MLVVVTHMLVDRWKVKATRRAERNAQDAARARMAATGDTPGLGAGQRLDPVARDAVRARTRSLHLTIAIVAWLVILEGVPLLQGFVDVVNTILRDWDRATVNAVVLTGVVLVSLFLVNTRAAYYFVLALVSPREVPVTPAVVGPSPDPRRPRHPRPCPPATRCASGRSSRRWSPGSQHPHRRSPRRPNQAGPRRRPRHSPSRRPRRPLRGVAVGGAPCTPRSSVPTGAPARIGATIGALERLLIVAFVLVGAEAAVGFVIAAKTIARFKQLDDRGFAEYYLLGTLASVSVALASAIIAKAALGTLP